MNIREQTIEAGDRYELGCTRYDPAPDNANRRTVIINSAVGVLRGYYGKYATFLCEHGYRVVTYDYRGIGDSLSGPVRDCNGSMEEWGSKDFPAILDAVAAEHGQEPILVIGHSAGGQIFGLTPRNRAVQALLLVSSQSGYWRHWPGWKRYAMAAMWYALMPGLTRTLSYCPMASFKLGENLPRGVALQWARWGRHPDYMVDDAGQPIRSEFAAFPGPVLSYSFADDGAAPAAAVDALAAYYQGASVERRHIAPEQIGHKKIGHFGFFRERFASTLWAESLAWLDAH